LTGNIPEEINPPLAVAKAFFLYCERKETMGSAISETASTCRGAVRDALGQLLEYAYYRPQSGSEKLELIIVAPGQLDIVTEAYIRRLQTDFHTPISYCSHSGPPRC
jgi:hypothetical protein